MPACKVLVIEDDAIFGGIVETYLTKLGYQVTLTTDGETGLALCALEKPDVVICDLILPNLSGLEVLEQLIQATVSIPVIVISASERMSDIRDAVQLGASDYLIKPLQQLATLDQAIQNCLTVSSLEDAWERERWELDNHIDVLFRDDHLIDSLVGEFTPQDRLSLPMCEISHTVNANAESQVLVVYQRFPNHGAFVLIAKSQAATGQDIIALLVLKSLLNPYLRQGFSSKMGILRTPQRLLELLNQELCHSRIRSAFDVAGLWVDGATGELSWAHCGDKVVINTASRPDLAIGIWAQASFTGHRGKLGSEPFTMTAHGASVSLTPRR